MDALVYWLVAVLLHGHAVAISTANAATSHTSPSASADDGKKSTDASPHNMPRWKFPDSRYFSQFDAAGPVYVPNEEHVPTPRVVALGATLQRCSHTEGNKADGTCESWEDTEVGDKGEAVSDCAFLGVVYREDGMAAFSGVRACSETAKSLLVSTEDMTDARFHKAMASEGWKESDYQLLFHRVSDDDNDRLDHYCYILHYYTSFKYPEWHASADLDRSSCLSKLKESKGIKDVKNLHWEGSKNTDLLRSDFLDAMTKRYSIISSSQHLSKARQTVSLEPKGMMTTYKNIYVEGYGPVTQNEAFDIMWKSILQLHAPSFNSDSEITHFNLLKLVEATFALPQIHIDLLESAWEVSSVPLEEWMNYPLDRARPFCFINRRILERLGQWEELPIERTGTRKVCDLDADSEWEAKVVAMKGIMVLTSRLLHQEVELYQLAQRLVKRPSLLLSQQKRELEASTEKYRAELVEYKEGKTEVKVPKKVVYHCMLEAMGAFSSRIPDRAHVERLQAELKNLKEQLKSKSPKSVLRGEKDEAKSLLKGIESAKSLLASPIESSAPHPSESSKLAGGRLSIVGLGLASTLRRRSVLQKQVRQAERALQDANPMALDSSTVDHFRKILTNMIEDMKSKDEATAPDDLAKIWIKWLENEDDLRKWQLSADEKAYWSQFVPPIANDGVSLRVSKSRVWDYIGPTSRPELTLPDTERTGVSKSKTTEVSVSSMLDLDLDGFMASGKLKSPRALWMLGDYYSGRPKAYYEVPSTWDAKLFETDYLCFQHTVSGGDNAEAEALVCPGFTARDMLLGYLPDRDKEHLYMQYKVSMALETEESHPVVAGLVDALEKKLKKWWNGIGGSQARRGIGPISIATARDDHKSYVAAVFCLVLSDYVAHKYPLWWEVAKEDVGQHGLCTSSATGVNKKDWQEFFLDETANMPTMPVFVTPTNDLLFSTTTKFFDTCKEGNTNGLIHLAANVRRWGRTYQTNVMKVTSSFGATKIPMYKRTLGIMKMLDKIMPLAYSAITDPRFLMEALEGAIVKEIARTEDEQFLVRYSLRDVCFQGLVSVMKACQSVLETTNADQAMESVMNESTRAAIEGVYDGFIGILESLPFIGPLSKAVKIAGGILKSHQMKKERQLRTKLTQTYTKLYSMELDIDAIIEYKNAAAMHIQSQGGKARKRDVVCRILDLFCSKSDASRCDRAADLFFKEVFGRVPEPSVECNYSHDRGSALMPSGEPSMFQHVIKTLWVIMPALKVAAASFGSDFLADDGVADSVPTIDLSEDDLLKSVDEKQDEAPPTPP